MDPLFIDCIVGYFHVTLICILSIGCASFALVFTSVLRSAVVWLYCSVSVSKENVIKDSNG